MSERTVDVAQANPDSLIYFALNYLTRLARRDEVNYGEWGICEAENLYWAGSTWEAEGLNILKVSLLEILEKRNEDYPEWGEEEVIVFVFTEGKTRTFKWFLKSKDESDGALDLYNNYRSRIH